MQFFWNEMFACEITIINLNKNHFQLQRYAPHSGIGRHFRDQINHYLTPTARIKTISSKWIHNDPKRKWSYITCSYLFLTRRLECRMEHRLSWFVNQSGVNIATWADKWLNQSGFSYIQRYQWEGIRNVATKLSKKQAEILNSNFPRVIKISCWLILPFNNSQTFINLDVIMWVSGLVSFLSFGFCFITWDKLMFIFKLPN